MEKFICSYDNRGNTLYFSGRGFSWHNYPKQVDRETLTDRDYILWQNNKEFRCEYFNKEERKIESLIDALRMKYFRDFKLSMLNELTENLDTDDFQHDNKIEIIDLFNKMIGGDLQCILEIHEKYYEIKEINL